MYIIILIIIVNIRAITGTLPFAMSKYLYSLPLSLSGYRSGQHVFYTRSSTINDININS